MTDARNDTLNVSVLSQFIRFRRGPWENLATIVIGIGVVMLMQPYFATAYAYSFVTILAGTLAFAVVSHFPE
jgi:drug/metabolite transporter (DMT)-like permease